jgi:hypothetical protein
MHLFVAIAPWLGRGEINGFWHFNKSMFLRLLTAYLFTIVLYGGLAIALMAVENLFELYVPGERYGQLWVLLTGMFMTWFFLAGVPDDLDALDAMDEYPKGLKIFSQYVLFPLVAVYLLILVAYSGKILVEWSWPYGWVSRLILGFSGAGIFSLLLLHPIRNHSENRWILMASRWFYIALAPLLVMYFLAVLRRLSDYGLTEARYLGIVIGIWLAVMTLYFLISREKNIKIVPLSLCILAFLISVGPWGAFAVSENSQVSRLQSLMEKNALLADGKAHAAEAPVPAEDVREISAALQYLHEMHGYGEIQSWFAETLRQDSLDMHSEWKDPSDVAGMIGIDYVSGRFTQPGGILTFTASLDDAMIVTGYDGMFHDRSFAFESTDRTVTSGEASYSLNSSLDTLTFIVAPPAESADTILLPLRPITDSLLLRYDNAGASDIPQETMAVQMSGSRLNVKVYLLQLYLKGEEGSRYTQNIRLRVLYGMVSDE